LETEAHANDLCQSAEPFRLGFLCAWLICCFSRI
jgi:hypothetical protein